MFQTYKDDLKLPERKTELSAGYDFYLPESITINPQEIKKINSNIFLNDYLPKGIHGELKIRSSLGIMGLTILGGIIDGDYVLKDIYVIICNTSDEIITLEKNDRYCQMILIKHDTFGENVDYKRNGGLGSTGK